MYRRRLGASVLEAFSALVMPALHHLSVTVFLHELAVATSVHVRTFEAVAVLGLFDGRSVGLAVLEDALKLQAVGVMDSSSRLRTCRRYAK